MKQVGDILSPKNRWHKEVNSQEWDDRRRAFLSATKPDHCPGCRQAKPLQVHHINYDGDRHLWEYDDSELIAVCFECHKRYHAMFRTSRSLFIKIPPAKLSELLGCLKASLEYNGVEATVNKFRRLVEHG